MAGTWSKTATAHTRLMLSFADGSKIFYNDIRNFGTIKFVKTQAELDYKLGTLGPDMLQEDVSNEVFRAIVHKYRKKTLPEILMNQKAMSGVGNYLKAEALYFAKLSPHKKGEDLTDAQIDLLNTVIKKIIRDSYANGGSTFRTYVDMNGETGSYGERFAVYKRKTDPLGNKVISEETKDKRTTWWVPGVQKQWEEAHNHLLVLQQRLLRTSLKIGYTAKSLLTPLKHIMDFMSSQSCGAM